MRALAFLLFLSLGAGAALPFPVHAQVTALTEDCKAAGPQPLGGFQFIEGCALRARAPDGRHAIG
jgi:hypothetical protein